MKTQTLLNIGIVACLIGILMCAVLWINIVDKPNAISPKPKAPDTVRTKDSCDWCGVIKTYSLDVNCYHYGDSVGE